MPFRSVPRTDVACGSLLSVAAWLHDCGKLATPDSVLDKSTKLHSLHDRIEMVAARFAVLRSEAERRYERDALTEPAREPEFRERMEEAVQTLSDDLTFLERINKGGESMAPEDQARVRRIAETVWIDAHGQRRPTVYPCPRGTRGPGRPKPQRMRGNSCCSSGGLEPAGPQTPAPPVKRIKRFKLQEPM